MSSIVGVRPQRGSRQKVAIADARGVKDALALAALTLEPDELSQRKLIETLMPELYLLRHKGHSFQQITVLLTQCGLNLQPSTLRNYYTEFLDERRTACEQRMADSLKILATLETAARKRDIGALTDEAMALVPKVQAARSDTATRAIFGGRIAAARTTPPNGAAGVSASPTGGARGPASRAAPSTPMEDSSPSSVSDEVQSAVARSDDQPPGHKSAPPNGGGGNFVAGVTDSVTPETPTHTKGAAARNSAAAETASANPKPQLHCMPLKPAVKPIATRPDVPKIVYETGDMEHPAIPGLMLSRDERLYGALLEISDEHGEVRTEGVKEKMFRVQWKAPIPETQTRTSNAFMKINDALFSGSEK